MTEATGDREGSWDEQPREAATGPWAEGQREGAVDDLSLSVLVSLAKPNQKPVAKVPQAIQSKRTCLMGSTESRSAQPIRRYPHQCTGLKGCTRDHSPS